MPQQFGIVIFRMTDSPVSEERLGLVACRRLQHRQTYGPMNIGLTSGLNAGIYQFPES